MPEKKLSIFERYLTVWVVLCIAGGIFLGKIAPCVAATLNDFWGLYLEIYYQAQKSYRMEKRWSCGEAMLLSIR